MYTEFESDVSSSFGELSSCDEIVTNSDGSPIVIPQTPPRTSANGASVRRLFERPIGTPANAVSVVTHRGFATRSEGTHPSLPSHRPQGTRQSEPPATDSRSTQAQMEAILQELRESNQTLHHITDRLVDVESRLKALEQSSVASIRDTTAASKKQKVPLEIRVTKPHACSLPECNVYLLMGSFSTLSQVCTVLLTWR